MKRLSVESMGDEVQGVRLRGDKHRQPEPTYFRVVFPGGDVDIVRTEDDEYWVHVRVNKPGRTMDEEALNGAIVDARLDIEGKHTAEVNAGDFADPGLYHLAVRVAPLRAAKSKAADPERQPAEEEARRG